MRTGHSQRSPVRAAIRSRTSRTWPSWIAVLVAASAKASIAPSGAGSATGRVSIALTTWTRAWCRAASACATRVAACAAGESSVARSTTRPASASGDGDSPLVSGDAGLASSRSVWAVIDRLRLVRAAWRVKLAALVHRRRHDALCIEGEHGSALLTFLSARP